MESWTWQAPRQGELLQIATMINLLVVSGTLWGMSDISTRKLKVLGIQWDLLWVPLGRVNHCDGAKFSLVIDAGVFIFLMKRLLCKFSIINVIYKMIILCRRFSNLLALNFCLSQGPMKPRLSSNLQSSQGWPWTADVLVCCPPSAGLQVFTSTPGWGKSSLYTGKSYLDLPANDAHKQLTDIYRNLCSDRPIMISSCFLLCPNSSINLYLWLSKEWVYGFFLQMHNTPKITHWRSLAITLYANVYVIQ